MTNILFLLILLSAHWVGDFPMQSDWMAVNKSRNNQALTIHVAIYMVPITVALTALAIWHGSRPEDLVFLALANFVAHFCTDWVTSRITAKLYKANERHWFFVAIGFDQLLHAWALGITVAVLVR